MLYRLDKLAGIFGICRQFLFQLTINLLTGYVRYIYILNYNYIYKYLYKNIMAL